MVAVHGRMMYQVPSSYDLVHKRIQRCDMSDHIHHRVIGLFFFYQPNLRYLRGHWSMEPWKSAKMWSQWRSQKKNRHAGESTESQAVGGLG